MLPEYASYKEELTQLKEGLCARVTELEAKVDLQPPLFSRLLDEAAKKLHVPWYQNTKTRVHSDLLEAQNRLAIAKGIQDLKIAGVLNGEWHATISIVEEGALDTIFLGHKLVHEHVGRSDWSRSEYSGGRQRTNIYRYGGVSYLVDTYGWIVQSALEIKYKKINPVSYK